MFVAVEIKATQQIKATQPCHVDLGSPAMRRISHEIRRTYTSQ